jgi:hypothetical protein
MHYIAVVATLLIISVLVVYKRARVRPWNNSSPRRAFYLSFMAYWLPAFLAWTWLIYTLTSIVSLPEPAPGILTMVGGSLLLDLTLRKELTALKRQR